MGISNKIAGKHNINRLYQNLPDNIIPLQAEEHFTALQSISKPSGKGFEIDSKNAKLQAANRQTIGDGVLC
jgi:hypothetical protein